MNNLLYYRILMQTDFGNMGLEAGHTSWVDKEAKQNFFRKCKKTGIS